MFHGPRTAERAARRGDPWRVRECSLARGARCAATRVWSTEGGSGRGVLRRPRLWLADRPGLEPTGTPRAIFRDPARPFACGRVRVDFRWAAGCSALHATRPVASTTAVDDRSRRALCGGLPRAPPAG